MTSRDAYDLGNLDHLDVRERREVLNAYLDGELSADDALIVSAWLDANPGALRELEHLRRIWDLLALYGDEPVPETFAAGVIQSVGIRHEPVRAGRVVPLAWYRRPMATAAAVLVAVGATAFVMSSREAGVQHRSHSATLEALGVQDLESLEYLDVIVDADDETFNELVADAGLGG